MTTQSKPDSSFSLALIAMMRGIVYREDDMRIWQVLLDSQARIRDYVSLLGLEPIIDEDEGYAYLRQRPPAEGTEPLPRLVPRRPLTYLQSLVLVLLRKRLAEADSHGVNASLRAIDYNPGRFIELVLDPTADIEIREFQRDLKACTEGGLAGSTEDSYSEAKFLDVKRIIERFRGREELTEADRRWTRKVTDVRNWFAFAASERWREDNREHEHYTDSGGKSGGQKEKLAYTVLAASVAYQFGLQWGETRSSSFRFVVIDEAFGRGSDESARYGLELFRRLNLQLVIATPLQKIHVIEPFVAGVGFVHNDGGKLSMLRNLTIEEYRAERAARAEG